MGLGARISAIVFSSPVILLVLSAACRDAEEQSLLAPAAPLSAATAVPPSISELPRVYLDTRYHAPTGRTINLSAGGNLQTAINTAQPGDVIVLQAGATFTGNFTLPKKATNGWITIRTSGVLPPEGTRVTPAKAATLARVMSPNSDAAFRTVPGVGVGFYRLTGLEITHSPTNRPDGYYRLILFGDGYGAETSFSQVPHDLVIDRSYVHGYAGIRLRTCVELNSARTAIIDSYIAECHGRNEESYAIKGWNGPGPFKIVNNFLSGAGLNILFGGADPRITGLVPSDIEIRRNHLYKNPAWHGVWSMKNIMTSKNAQRVLFEGNVFDGSWYDVAGQPGYAMILKSSNEEGRCTWCVTQDITLRYNKFMHSGAGVTVAADPPGGAGRAIPARRITIYQNVFDRLQVPGFLAAAGHEGLVLQTGGNVADLVIEHNTFIVTTTSVGPLRFANWGPLTRFRYVNNLLTRGSTGVMGWNGNLYPEGSSSLATFAPNAAFAGNAIIGAQASRYPAGNYFPATIGTTGFIDAAGFNWRLSTGSALKGRATDGTDPGAAIPAVEAATHGVR